MKIIDFTLYGNVLKLYLGRDDLAEWWGDDWDDAPYEHNAGQVYDRYVSETVQIALPIEYDLQEPCQFSWHGGNSPYSKEDMIKHTVPFLRIVKYLDDNPVSYGELYFGDDIDVALKTLMDLGGVVLHSPTSDLNDSAVVKFISEKLYRNYGCNNCPKTSGECANKCELGRVFDYMLRKLF